MDSRWLPGRGRPTVIFTTVVIAPVNANPKNPVQYKIFSQIKTRSNKNLCTSECGWIKKTLVGSAQMYINI